MNTTNYNKTPNITEQYMSQLSSFSVKELLTEITARAIKFGIANNTDDIGLYTIKQDVSYNDLDTLNNCEGTTYYGDEMLISPSEFRDDAETIGIELAEYIDSTREFGIKIVHTRH